MGDNFIRWLSNINKKDINLAGGKGANLGEMYNAKFPVPAAFIVTTDAFFYFLKETNLEKKIKDVLDRIDVDDTDSLSLYAKEIREMVIDSEMPFKLKSEIIEAYDHFNINLNDVSSPSALAILKSARESIFVSVRSSATAEDLKDASFAGQQESFINIKGNVELIEKVKEVFASIFTARSIFYRKKKGFNDFVGIAVIVQKMINSDKSGVIFSRDPIKNDDNILIEAVFGQGEGIVSGRIKPDQYIVNRKLDLVYEQASDKKMAIVRTAGGQTKAVQLEEDKSKQKVLKTHEIKQLAEYAIKLEKHYNKPQDIEFAIEDGEIFILQTRPITTLENVQKKSKKIDGKLLTEGLAASPGVASGIVKIINSMDDLKKIKKGDVLVTKMTNPDMVVSMQKASAIVTSEGGVTAHAAIVSREMGIPAIVGTQNAMDVLTDGQEVTVDGFNGKVYLGFIENKSVEILPIVKTKTKIKVLVDIPNFAERASKANADGVGLVRLEGIIAESGKHPLAYEREGNLDEYKEVIKKGLEEIAEYFKSKPIWVRTSDIRSDEYSNLVGSPKEIERNPMLGNHGIRFSLKHPKILRAELETIKELSQVYKENKFGVMIPQVISVEEIKNVKKLFEEIKMKNVSFGIMIETPAASILIKDFCIEGIDFVSFGTNDLTQYTLAIDRGNESVQYLYDEMNYAILKQISRVIRECKNYGVETSICGQAGSNPKMVEFLIKQGIDSISVNADAAKEISELVKKLESSNNLKDNSIEEFDNKESIKEEIKERETLEQERLEELKNEERVIVSGKKEDIFER